MYLAPRHTLVIDAPDIIRYETQRRVEISQVPYADTGLPIPCQGTTLTHIVQTTFQI